MTDAAVEGVDAGGAAVEGVDAAAGGADAFSWSAADSCFDTIAARCASTGSSRRSSASSGSSVVVELSFGLFSPILSSTVTAPLRDSALGGDHASFFLLSRRGRV